MCDLALRHCHAFDNHAPKRLGIKNKVGDNCTAIPNMACGCMRPGQSSLPGSGNDLVFPLFKNIK